MATSSPVGPGVVTFALARPILADWPKGGVVALSLNFQQSRFVLQGVPADPTTQCPPSLQLFGSPSPTAAHDPRGSLFLRRPVLDGGEVATPEDRDDDATATVLHGLDRLLRGEFREAIRAIGGEEAIGPLLSKSIEELGVTDDDLKFALHGIISKIEHRPGYAISALRRLKFRDFLASLDQLVGEAVIKKGEADEVFFEVMRIIKGVRMQQILPLFKRLGEIGVLAGDVRAAHGGLESPYASECRIIQRLGELALGPLQAAVMIAIGIARKPIEWRGTPAQLEKYMGRLVGGEIVAGFALAELDTGPDPSSMRTTATRTPDGQFWCLNGVKAFVTNGAVASVFVVFARTGDNEITAFLVDKSAPGFRLWQEHPNQLCLNGISIRPVRLDGVMLTDEARLGDRGEGLRIAYSALNVGRWRLAGSSSANLIHLIRLMVDGYDKRARSHQITGALDGTPSLIAEATINAFASQSVVYRLAGEVDRQIVQPMEGEETEKGRTIMGIWHRCLVEAAIAKVVASENYGAIAKRVVTAHGDAGIMSDNYAQEAFRNSIFGETHLGTNPLLRRLIVRGMLKRVEQEGISPTGSIDLSGDNPLSIAVLLTEKSKGLASCCFGLLSRSPSLKERVLSSEDAGRDSPLAELAIGAYTLDSVVRRALKACEKGDERKKVFQAIATVYAWREFQRLKCEAERWLATLPHDESGERQRARMFINLLGGDSLSLDEGALLDLIADHVIRHRGGYDF